MQNDLSRSGDDPLNRKKWVPLLKYLYSFYLAMWKADMKLEKTRYMIFKHLFLGN